MLYIGGFTSLFRSRNDDTDEDSEMCPLLPTSAGNF